MNLSQSFYVKPSSHEIVHTTVSLSPEQRPALAGTVVNACDKPVEDALVTFYRADAPSDPVGALYTDALGRFAFGPLEPGKLYHVTVFKQTDSIRALEQARFEPVPD
ncbi:MAG: carboxypeptidase regulatory-like domain-containing protein [Butyricicoccus pullicaecorum]|nr:carboxypeptidase regulatory-like domain-containing protein [Butyricicoccus pullicaecorum]